MATMRDALRTALEGDATLVGLLTGGVYDASELGSDGALPSSVFSSLALIQPCAVIRWRGEAPKEIREFTERRYVEIWYYADSSAVASLEAAKERAKVVLHRQQLSNVTGKGLNYVEFVDSQGEFTAEEYQNAAADMSRYIVYYSVTARKT